MEVHLRDIRYFVTVADELSVARAADRLCVSQPAVSKQLRALERRLGFDLFQRRPDGLLLTPEGHALRQQASDLLEQWQEAVDAARMAGKHTIQVGLQTSICGAVARALHARLAGCDWHLALRLVAWSDPSAGLDGGSSDAAVIWDPVDAALGSRVLATERRCVALSARHPLATRSAVRFAEIAEQPHVALPEAAGPARGYWLALDQRDGTEPPVRAEATTAGALFDLVARRVGVALVAESHGTTCARSGVRVVPVEDLPPAGLRLAWPRNDSNAALAVIVARTVDWIPNPV